MAEKIKLTISPAVAAFVRPGSSPELRLSGCSAALEMTAADRLMLLFCLSKDSEPTVRTAALSVLAELPADVIRDYQICNDAHPLVLEALPRLCKFYPSSTPVSATDIFEEADEPDTAVCDVADLEEKNGEEESPPEEDKEFLSKYKMSQIMGISEKIKMALSGDKEWRSLLVKDANKLVSAGVIKNPRITDGEILSLVKSGIQNDEIMRLICANKEWIKNYSIRKALIENNRTPIQNAMKYLDTMTEKDLASFAKSKNISSVISTLARRLVLNKKK
jgi:hypothetical protein